MSISAAPPRYSVQRSLMGREYFDPDIFALETEKIFRREWMCLGRAESIAQPGDYRVVDVGGDSLIVMRTREGSLRAFYNVCRHRGARLCEGSGHANKVLKCGYHAWTYDLDGNLVGTPNVGENEGFVRDDYPLWEVHLSTWAGFMFVNLHDEPVPLTDALRDDPGEPLQFERYDMGELSLGYESTHEVEANWKIIVDNYNECLHCPSVHPELSAIVPVFKRGEVEEDPDSLAVSLAEGATSFTKTGRSSLPPLPGVSGDDLHRYYGCYVFPNLTINITSDTVGYFLLLPRSASQTTVQKGSLWAKETMSSPTFDPSDIIEFGELVMQQDYDVCEMAQRGVSTTPFAKHGGVYPYGDRLLASFGRSYHEKMGIDDQGRS